jgi:hypothetical protein
MLAYRMAESLESRKYDNSRSKRGIASASSLSGSEFTGKRIDGGGAARQGEVRAFRCIEPARVRQSVTARCRVFCSNWLSVMRRTSPKFAILRYLFTLT